MKEDLINYSAEIISAYLEKYPNTNVFDLLELAVHVNAEVDRSNGQANKEEIVEKVHKLMQEPFDIMSLFGVNQEEPCKSKKHECHCQNKHIDNGKEEVIKVVLPGIAKEQISLKFDEDVLYLSVQNNDADLDIYNDYKRQFTISKDCDVDKLTAKLDLGILTIVIPKKKKVDTTRTIEIN